MGRRCNEKVRCPGSSATCQFGQLSARHASHGKEMFCWGLSPVPLSLRPDCCLCLAVSNLHYRCLELKMLMHRCMLCAPRGSQIFLLAVAQNRGRCCACTCSPAARSCFYARLCRRAGGHLQPGRRPVGAKAAFSCASLLHIMLVHHLEPSSVQALKCRSGCLPASRCWLCVLLAALFLKKLRGSKYREQQERWPCARWVTR